MGTTRSVQPVTSCAFCDGPMPPPSATGRPAVFCSGTCRKAAYEARRGGAPRAFEVKVVERVVVESHDLAGCVARVFASPAACRRVLQALTALVADGTLGTDPKWRPTQEAAKRLGAVVTAPPSRLPHRRT